DRKSTRLNSSHSQISYAVFCLKKKNRNLIGGGSAGANLCVATLLRLRARHDACGAVSGATLSFGVYDFSRSLVGEWRRDDLSWTAMANAYVGHLSPEQRGAPDISSIDADLSGMPSALFTVGSEVFFFNDSAPTEIYTLSLHDALPI